LSHERLSFYGCKQLSTERVRQDSELQNGTDSPAAVEFVHIDLLVE